MGQAGAAEKRQSFASPVPEDPSHEPCDPKTGQTTKRIGSQGSRSGLLFCASSACQQTDIEEGNRKSLSFSPLEQEFDGEGLEGDVKLTQALTQLAEHKRRLAEVEKQLKEMAVKKRASPPPLLAEIIERSRPGSPDPEAQHLLESEVRRTPSKELSAGTVKRTFIGSSTKSGTNWLEKDGFKVSPSSAKSRTLTKACTVESNGDIPVKNVKKRKQGRSFDQDMLKAIYEKPYRKARQSGALVGGGVLGLMSMPFGPIGMVAGGTFGGVVGGAIGYWIDKRTTTQKLAESQAEWRRLKSLVRWALDHFHDDDEFFAVIEMVTLEFKPVADIATGSKHARKLLKLLDGWIAQKKVTRKLWVYMDMLLERWRDLNRADFLRSMRVFQTLKVMYRYTQRVLDDQEVQFIERMEKLLEHESIKLVLVHAQLYPTEGESRLMECMVYADALGGKKKRGGSGNSSGAGTPVSHGVLSPELLGNECAEDISDVSDGDNPPSHQYSYGSTPKGIMLTPLGATKDARAKPALSLQDIDAAQEFDQEMAEPRRVLKKPFFKSWQDFMDFDLTFKHKMPITLSEFDLLRQKNEESLKGWDVCVERKEIKVAKVQNDTGCITLRAWATVPGVDLYVAFYLFVNHLERVKWDKIFAKMDVIESNAQGSEILYSLMKVPAVTPRDFLQYRRCRIEEDGSIHIVLRSAEHPEMPDQKGAIRAESYIAGYILRQTFDGNLPVLKIFLMSSLDIKGYIPKWIINMQAPRKPADWVETLRKAALDYQESNPGYKETLMESLKHYREDNPFDFEDMPPEPKDDECRDRRPNRSSEVRSEENKEKKHTPRTEPAKEDLEHLT